MNQSSIADLDDLSPFELQDELGRLAQKADVPEVLDAGKGQPNWLASTPRYAFHLLGQFALAQAEKVSIRPDAGWFPDLDGMDERLAAYLDEHRDHPGAETLGAVVDLGVEKLGFERNAWVGELAVGMLGDRYPWPHRMLAHVEQLLHLYLTVTHLGPTPPEGRFRLFGTEGGAGAMSYVFQSLQRNGLLVPGDSIAIGTPIFSPYLQIPMLAEFGFDMVYIRADEKRDWRYPANELGKLRDPKVKAFFIVNPGNPGTRAMGAEELAVVRDIVVNDRPDLIVLTDTAYATFVEQFHSFLAELPHNTIGVHSFSKHFGATGERIAILAMHEDHVIDKLLQQQPPGERGYRAERYRTVTDDLDEFAFIDRVVADSRQVALYHVAGLATAQQVKMALLAGFALLDKGQAYLAMTREVVEMRLRALLGPLELDMPADKADTHYYSLLEILELARRRHGDAFAKWLNDTQHPLSFPIHLAEKYGIVALPGRGFEATGWSVRISLANLRDTDYPTIAAAVHATIDDMYADFEKGSSS
jgi:aspartate 4-decarboxylase